jgi:hypothetical protein
MKKITSEKIIRKIKNKIKSTKKREEHYGDSPSYPPYTARRSFFLSEPTGPDISGKVVK